MSWRMDGYRVLITGASKGIGAAVADVMLERGAQVWLVARGEQDLQQYADQLNSRYPDQTVVATAVDVINATERAALLEDIGWRWGGLDCLVNNVGSNIRLAANDYSENIYRRLFETNLDSAFFLTQSCYSWLRESSTASVVNIASVAGLAHMRSGVVYGMTKAAMLQMTRNLAVEWAEDGIRVNAVAPWYTDTPLARQVLDDAEYRDAVLARTPMQRIGSAQEMATATAFLCMPAAGYVTGQCLSVDGGVGINLFS